MGRRRLTTSHMLAARAHYVCESQSGGPSCVVGHSEKERRSPRRRRAKSEKRRGGGDRCDLPMRPPSFLSQCTDRWTPDGYGRLQCFSLNAERALLHGPSVGIAARHSVDDKHRIILLVCTLGWRVSEGSLLSEEDCANWPFFCTVVVLVHMALRRGLCLTLGVPDAQKGNSSCRNKLAIRNCELL